MTPERWERVQSVFAAALQREPLERAAFLQSVSQSDTELVKEVESLLHAHQNTPSKFPESPVVAASSRALPGGGRLGTYEILEQLGSGGMGEVYRARDRKLDREVAIKVLPAHLSSSPAALSRFEREAKAVAALSHPNILSIHDFGSQDGTAYAVMELLEGETLRAKLEGGPMTARTAVDYALQMAKGLAAAHERGIVHRDLKPENIFVSRDGHLKILDFGLAKREDKVAPGEETSAPTASGQTEPGTVMGTVGYMSPEQVRAIAADHRSDVFSFGAILYEMLAGRRAFRKDTAGDTLAAILRDVPLPLAKEIPEALSRIAFHCLEKDRDNRFQSARDIVFALGETASGASSGPTMSTRAAAGRSQTGIWTVIAASLLAAAAVVFWSTRFRPHTEPSANAFTAPAPARAKRIVVLPFENLGDAQDAYFASGITEEMINRLASLQGVTVISRATAFGYDRKGKTIKQIGADLGVDFVLEGTVRWDRGKGHSGRVRIAPELVQVADDAQLWGQRYDRVIADIFSLQSEVAENVVRSMGMKLAGSERAVLAGPSTTNLEAYDFYLRGLEATGRSQAVEDQRESLQMFQEAVKRDPRFAPALAQLARSHLSLYYYFDRFRVPPDTRHIDAAKEAIDVLDSLGPALPDTHLARGYYLYWGFDRLDPAMAEFRAAIALQPSSVPALEGRLFILRRQGRWEEAGRELPRLSVLDPRNPEVLQQCGMTSLFRRAYADADRYYAQATEFNRRYGVAWGQRAMLQVVWRGDLGAADRLLAEARGAGAIDEDFAWLDYTPLRLAFLARDFPGVLDGVERLRGDAINRQWFYLPAELIRADTYAAAKDVSNARRWYSAARERLTRLVQAAPKDARYHSALGVACAGLGLRSEALNEARAGVDLMPATVDSWRRMYRIEDQARVHAMLGEVQPAIEELDFLLSGGSDVSAPVLRLDPNWDPVRSDPRFQALLAKYADAK